MIIFIDMDGVLADFHGAALARHGRQDLLDDPSNLGPSFWGIDELCYPGEPEKFWTPFDQEFWANLPILDGASELVAMCRRFAGGSVRQIFLLSSPSRNPGCVDGKMQWIRRHVLCLENQTIFTSHKHLLAAGREIRLLIDDGDHFVREFGSAGGCGFLVPRKWNSLHAIEDGAQYITRLEHYLTCLETWETQFPVRTPNMLETEKVPAQDLSGYRADSLSETGI